MNRGMRKSKLKKGLREKKNNTEKWYNKLVSM
jgi:hypothetical protein